ncbi:MAG: phosphoglycolate phosphatase [Chloroflexi bacterium]|jgi:putative hydrolase of the HAD superfamily|nr:phosphoglycolate phosphatase [Chloroflexota bacterium]|tara:strand:- start:1278 stop:2003 length:726 start_codon:yes stop_codon:yes gene_type:complete
MPDGYPGAMLLDLDDTILAFDRDAASMWLNVSREFEDRLPGVTPQQLGDAVEEFREWYWSDPVRHKIARLDLLKARRDVMTGTFQRLGIDDLDLAAEIGEAYAVARDATIAPFPGAIDAVKAFRGAGVRLALVTNGSSAAQRSKIDRFGLERLFDHVQIEGEFGAGKPEPSVYLHALERVGGTPSDAWMVGDNLEWEVAAPQRLGIIGIWNDWQGAGLPPESTVRPDRIITSLSELVPGSA